MSQIPAAELARAVLRVVHRYPDAVLVPNQVGNWTIVTRPGPKGYVGYIDVTVPAAVLFDEWVSAPGRSRPTTPPHPSPG